MIERFTPSPSQSATLSEADYAELSGITIARLQAIEAGNTIPDIEGMSEAKIEAWLEEQRQTAEQELAAAIADFIDGKTTAAETEAKISEAITTGILLALLFTIGGLAALRASQNPRALILQAKDTIDRANRSIQGNFAAILSGQMTPGQIVAISRRRTLTFRSQFEQSTILNNIISKGHNEGIRRINSVHPCPSCPGYERLDWVPISDIVPVATLCECMDRCKCSVVTRFNPERALAELTGGSLINRVESYKASIQQTERDYLIRNGWL